MKTLYLIHGWTYTIEPWTATLELLKQAGIKVKLLKVPGLTEPSKKVWTIDDYVKWADQQIPNGAIALGHSNGGRILLNLCANNPQKLSHLILLASAGVYEPSRRKNFITFIAKLGKPLKKITLINKLFHHLTGSTDYSQAPKNMQKTLTNLLYSDQTLKISTISTPTLILWGKKDTVTPIRHAHYLHQHLLNSQLKIFSNWTHAPYISHPRELAKTLISIMQDLDK